MSVGFKTFPLEDRIFSFESLAFENDRAFLRISKIMNALGDLRHNWPPL